MWWWRFSYERGTIGSLDLLRRREARRGTSRPLPLLSSSEDNTPFFRSITKGQSTAPTRSDKVIGDMDDRENPEHIERMLNVMTLVPAYGRALLLAKVGKKIGTDALQKIIERVYHQTERRKVQDLKRAFAGI
jgi:hypothetical protein